MQDVGMRVNMSKGAVLQDHQRRVGNFGEPSEGKEGIFSRFWKTHNMTVAMVTGTNIFGGGACDST